MIKKHAGPNNDYLTLKRTFRAFYFTSGPKYTCLKDLKITFQTEYQGLLHLAPDFGSSNFYFYLYHSLKS